MDDDKIAPNEKDLAITQLVQAHDVEDAENVIKAEHDFTEKQYSRLRWKIDLIIMPCLMLVYGLQYSDKNSLSSGAVFGLRTDTHLVGNQYANLTVWFYIAYLAGQVPMQYVLQRVPIGKGLGVSVVLWGICVLCLGACNNYTQLSLVRTLLGWFECAVTPGFLLIIASWYKRSESTLRSCMFFAMNTFFGIVFGLIIYFLARHSETSGGPAGWRVINYFLGAMTIFAGGLIFAFVGTPEEVWWLTKEQKVMARARILSNATGGGERHPWKWAQVRECFRDPQYWFAVMFNLMATIPNGALGTFSVLVYVSFGFSSLESILYGLPSNAVGFTFILLTAITVTKYPRARFPAAILWNIVPMIIFLYVGLSDGGKWQKWAAFTFISVFAITTFMFWSIIPLNTAGRTKKSFLGASQLVAYCVGNIIGAKIFLASDAPKYLHGLTACAIVMAVNTVNICCWWCYYYFTNKKRERAFVASGLSMEERLHLNKLAGETDVTDMENPHFRYTC